MGSARGDRAVDAGGGIQCMYTGLQSAARSRKGTVNVDCTPQELLVGNHSDCAVVTSVIQVAAATLV